MDRKSLYNYRIHCILYYCILHNLASAQSEIYIIDGTWCHCTPAETPTNIVNPMVLLFPLTTISQSHVPGFEGDVDTVADAGDVPWERLLQVE